MYIYKRSMHNLGQKLYIFIFKKMVPLQYARISASYAGHELIRVYTVLENGSDLDWVNPDSLFGSDPFV